MAIAWLLVSSVDVDHCENVLGTVLRSEDLDRAFGSGDSSEEDTREACDGVLQGLAALEVKAFFPYSWTVTGRLPVLMNVGGLWVILDRISIFGRYGGTYFAGCFYPYIHRFRPTGRTINKARMRHRATIFW